MLGKRRIFATGAILLTATILSALMVSPVLGRQGGPAQPEVETVVFVDYGYPTHAGPGPHPACGDTDGNEGFHLIRGGIEWPAGTVNYDVISSLGDPISGSAFLTVAAAAFGAWDSVADDISLAEVGGSANTVSFGTIDGSGSAIGVATVSFNPATKEILEFDIVLDVAEPWAIYTSETCPTPAGQTTYDVQNILAHEAGHGLGLDHVHSPADGLITMYRFTQLGETIKRSLGNGDVDGINALYD